MARHEPESATGRMLAARRHRHQAYAQRNEVIAALQRVTGWEGHLMPLQGPLATLGDNMAACLHTPRGPLAWVITTEEADKQFKDWERTKRHPYDKTQDARTMDLSMLKAEPKKARKRVKE